MNKRVIILLCFILVAIPIALNFVIQQPALFSVIGEPKDWLMFWATYLGAAASFIMIVYTGVTLKHNKAQLDELKRQWEEEHKPEIAVCIFGRNQTFHIRIKNISKVTVSNVSITITHDPTKENIMNYDKWKQSLENLTFSIEPNGYRDIELMVSHYVGITYNEFIGLQFDFNDKYKYNVNLSFDEASLLNCRSEEQELLYTIEKIANEINRKQL